MKALPKRKGNRRNKHELDWDNLEASMKALPKRKGNPTSLHGKPWSESLNESPSEKEGK